MKIAIDLDNTLFEYDNLLHIAAKEEGITEEFNTKEELKEIAKNNYKWPDKWIQIQGLLYGSLVKDIKIRTDLLDFLENSSINKFDIHITSHKTKNSFCSRFQLQEAAIQVLQERNITDLIPTDRIHFFETKEEKVKHLKEQEYDIVIDDLEEIASAVKSNKTLVLLFHEVTQQKFLTTKNWKLIEQLANSFNFISRKNKIQDIKKISKQTLKLITENKIFYCKVFNNIDRLDREAKVLKQLYDDHVIYITENILITKDLETTPLKSLSKKDILPLGNALKRISQIKSDNEATHATLTYPSYRKNLEDRMESLELDSDHRSKLTIIKNYILDKIPSNIQIRGFNIAPDFFKGNLSRHKKEIIIHDFESFGFDDPARAFLNFIHHIGHMYSKEEVLYTHDSFKHAFQDEGLDERIKILFNYVALDWLLIMAKRRPCQNSDDKNKLLDMHINRMFKKVQNKQEIISWKEDIYEYIFSRM